MNVKRIIAREMLILLGFVLLGGLFLKTGELGFKHFFKDYYWQEIVVPKKEYADLSEQDKKDAHKQYESEFKPDISWALKHKTTEAVFWSAVIILGRWILFFCYPVYLLVRFIVWAIRTLRTKND
jgi:hypothetical protein